MQAYVTLGARSPSERSTPIYATRQYRQLGRPGGNRLGNLLTPNVFKNSTVTLNHGTSYVTLNDNSNLSSSYYSGPTSPISSAPSQFTSTSNNQPYIRHKLVPNTLNKTKLQCHPKIVREIDPMT